MPAPEPATTGSIDSVPVTAKSTSRVTEVLSVEESFPELESVSVTAVTATVLLIVFVPVAAVVAAVTTTVKVAEAPEARAPTVHVGAEKLVPPLGVVETKVTFDGTVRDSLKVTPVASDGPLFVTVTT